MPVIFFNTEALQLILPIMKLASVSDIKQTLENLTHKELLEMCTRLVKYKKDNKELLNYLLYQSGDEDGFIEEIKEMVNEEFTTVNRFNLYFAKKTIRKILKTVNKHIKYSGSKETEVQLLLHFCTTLDDSGISYKKNTALNNLYLSQLKKIEKVISTLHEDLQYDYLRQLDKLR